ncbi:FAD-binding oxidoreductase [Brevibacillus sp. SYSU BS000544]|uniref:FAD-binding oxidoreductase n=1 Tax=Brevibacillus sp. SYSU BS000544 TaxID=3416443 RepID=UPI003CE5B7F5
MIRWNGWGEESIDFPLPASAKAYLASVLGMPAAPSDISVHEMEKLVPESRLPDHSLIKKDKFERITHSVGQSMPDWIAIRGGRVTAFPDGVAYPETEDEVHEILRFARQSGAIVIPYGGGTSVVGHLTVPKGERPVISVDMGRMNKLLTLDRESGIAIFQAGIKGPDLEAALRAQGYTLGHFPQSFEYSTLGGWVVTRSAGQFSLEYGRIERLFVGGTIMTPQGKMTIPLHPASAGGPDIREMILGSEGRMGIVTESAVKVTPLPESESFYGAFFPDQEQAIKAVRMISQAKIPLTMMRLSLPTETATMLMLNGKSTAMEWLQRYLSFRGIGEKKCMLLFGASGSKQKTSFAIQQSIAIIKAHKGVSVGQKPGKQWYKNRFRMPYLRNTLWEAGLAVDTLETATTWQNVPATVKAIEQALQMALDEFGEKVHAFTHLSHVYPHGSSIYTTFLFRVAATPEETLRRWQKLKSSASQAIVERGATISHQHGVGEDHLPYLPKEKGELGMRMMHSLCQTLDPEQIMNPGKLFQ